MSDIEKDQENLGEEKSEDPSFDPKLKKKKKKKPVPEDAAEQPETNESPPETNENQTEEIEKENRDKTEENEEQAEDEAVAMFSDLKKKKKKKKNPIDDEKPEEEPTETGEFGDLSTMKKKRRKKPADLAAFEEQLKDGEDEEDRNEDVFVAEGEEEKEKPFEETWLGSDRDYTYQELLGRVFKIIRQNNPELAGEKKRYTIVPPSVHREGNKKTIFANIADICKRMHRQPEHTIQFLFAELGTSGSIDGSQRLVIKGRFQQKQIENVLRRYIVEYVTCKTCKSPDTILTKENRIFFMQCESCGSQRSVSAIKSGYHAQTEKRAVQRRAAQ